MERERCERKEQILVAAAFKKARGFSGRRRLPDDLPEMSSYKVRKHMKSAGLKGYQRGSWKGCTNRDRSQLKSPDRLDRDFTVERPNQVWVSDVTEFETTGGKVCACAVTDLYARRIIANTMSDANDSDLTVKALRAAMVFRGVTTDHERIVFHSDQGSNYTSDEMKRCARALAIIDLSNGSTGDCFDNAVSESVFATLKEEWYHHAGLLDPATLSSELNDYISWYNTTRRHSYNGNQSPEMTELLYYAKQAA